VSLLLLESDEMPYATVSEVRTLTGLTESDVSDSELGEFIDIATQMIIEDLTISVKDEEPVGDIDGSNTTFSVSNYPIADVSGDRGTVGSADVTVWTWTDKEDPSTKSSVGVDTVYSRDGQIVLTSAPPGSVEMITIDYSYTLEDDLNWDLIKVACAYLAAFLFCVQKFTVLPDSVRRGPITFRHYTKPYNEYLDKYYEMMSLVKSHYHVKKTSSDMTLHRRRM